jgi:signal transduction histidine kinase
MPAGQPSAAGGDPGAGQEGARPTAGAPPAQARGGRPPRLALSARALLLLCLVNLLGFSAAGALLVREIGAQQEAQALGLYSDFLRTLRATIRPERELNVASILTWPGWTQVEDALLVDRNLIPGPSGVPIPQGIVLNPVGRVRRPLGDGDREILPALARAIEIGQESEVAGGWVVPIPIQGRNWGACWFRLPDEERILPLVQSLLPGFLVSTLLLSAATFLALRRLVLEPVAELHRAAQGLERGELSARVPLSSGAGELSELGAAFNRMAERMEGFSRELELQVEHATQQARLAERAALTQRRLAAMGELAAGIAHEINNPLGGLTNAVRALETKQLDPQRRERYLALLREGLERIRTIVARVLSTAPRPSQPRPVVLLEVARDALLLVAHRAREQGVALVLRLGARELEPEAALDVQDVASTRVLGAHNELAQAVLNLLANALDALEGGVGARLAERPRVELALEPHGGELWLSVRDNGPGAPAEALARARDLFFTTKEVGRGTGLGLSIVHAIAEAHGGRLVLESEAGAGFCATLVLPCGALPPA